MFPLSTPFLLTKPGERMVMYLCARDIDVSSFYAFSIGFWNSFYIVNFSYLNI